MIDLRKRITGVDEIMDDPELPEAQLTPVLKGLARLNDQFGGHDTVISALKKFPVKQHQRVSDWGCGGGDVLRAVAKWARSNALKLDLTGIDAAPAAIAYAQQQSADHSNISYRTQDVFAAQPVNGEYDVVISNLFTHHFEDEAWIALIKQMYNSAGKGVVIVDLHRHWLLYYALKVMFRFIIPNKIMLYDGPLSVRRGFKRSELKDLLSRAGITNYKIQWKWAFQWLVVIHKV
jgi:2-polyprenyl-3-methyl-5-hydroxy-6-metoxy-1,4-benzoquinol methylase